MSEEPVGGNETSCVAPRTLICFLELLTSRHDHGGRIMFDRVITSDEGALTGDKRH